MRNLTYFFIAEKRRIYHRKCTKKHLLNGTVWYRMVTSGKEVVANGRKWGVRVSLPRKVFCMLVGEYNHTIDEKGRLIIPAKLREDLGEKVIICKGLEGCLFVYSMTEWEKFAGELETLPRMNKDARIFKRYFFGSANEGSFDKQGRVLITPTLREAAELKKDVVLVGVQDRVEIWDKACWDERNDVSEEDLDAIAERMEAIGIRI